METRFDIIRALDAKKMNKLNADHLIRKLIAYKCPKCLKWHVGRTYATLSDKAREN